MNNAVRIDTKNGDGPFAFSTYPLPDGVVIGGPWPDTIITWPTVGDAPRSRRATKPEYDMFQALENQTAINADMLTTLQELTQLHEDSVFICGADDEERVGQALCHARNVIRRATQPASR